MMAAERPVCGAGRDDFGPLRRKRQPWLALGDLGEHALQVGAGEGPVERSGDLAVVLAEAQ